MCVCVLVSHVQLFVTPWTVAHQALLSQNSPDRNIGGGFHFLPFPSDPGMEPRSPALQAYFLLSEPPGKPSKKNMVWYLEILPDTDFPVAQTVKRQCRKPELDSWVRKILVRREWQSTPVFLLGESHWQRSLPSYSRWGRRVRYDWVANTTWYKERVFWKMYVSLPCWNVMFLFLQVFVISS